MNFVEDTLKLLIFGILAIGLVVVFLIFKLYSIKKFLKKLILAIQKVAKKNFDINLPSQGDSEIKSLIENFNFMVSEIKNAMEEISYEKDRLKKIFSSIQEAVVLLDTEGRILLYNDKFKKLCKVSPENRHYLEVLISSEFNELIKKVLTTQKNIIQEIEISFDTYLCSVSFVSEKELVVLFYNITQHKALQSIKKELVLNIIHELKTPLTSIKGFSETLYEEIKDKTYRNYLEIILSNTDRLIRIINELTLLSQIEHKEVNLELEDVNLPEVLNTIKNLFEHKIKQKNLNFYLEIKKDMKPIKADKFLLEQVLINLIDNSIRYTEKGYIKVSVTQDHSNTFIQVEDTGIGIPKEYHQRVFERFFVVDKARSRQTGGTGLGLSIVKHIVEIHKGEIFLESQVGVGTKFTVVLNNKI
ncbi:MAG: ATP-binding protein [Endomicrobiia bacterium]